MTYRHNRKQIKKHNRLGYSHQIIDYLYTSKKDVKETEGIELKEPLYQDPAIIKLERMDIEKEVEEVI